MSAVDVLILAGVLLVGLGVGIAVGVNHRNDMRDSEIFRQGFIAGKHHQSRGGR